MWENDIVLPKKTYTYKSINLKYLTSWMRKKSLQN